ncbi:hypothetical protein N4P33_27960 [Streptomyces sp. 15-116A]|nr:hypothetical protein [Streptomyces sp. 15-116A]MCT7355957.1 hypothetical protein [Streptomyces sp. 15-116A]
MVALALLVPLMLGAVMFALDALEGFLFPRPATPPDTPPDEPADSPAEV